MKRKLLKIAYLMWIVLSIIQCTQQTKVDDLSWPEVKPENKPGTYWWWMGSAVDKENLTYNLESLAGAGIGNVHIIPIYGVEGEEKRYIDFLNASWMNMLEYTVDEANRLNMNVDMSTTTGWPFGGSHVAPADAAKKIELKKITLSQGEIINEKFEPQKVKTIMAYSDNRELIDLMDKLDSTGTFNWIAPKGKWNIYILIQEGTGQKVKRAAPGNIGLVLDPFSPQALKNYLTQRPA